VNHNDKEIVLALRTALAERIGRDRFDVWFGSGVSLQVDGRTVRISASDQFALDRIRNQFRGDLEVVCKPIFGAPVPVEFELDSAAASKRQAAKSAAGSSSSAPLRWPE